MTLAAVTLALWCAGWVVLARMRSCKRESGTRSTPTEGLSVIIPARNERSNLPTLLRSLATQSAAPCEIIVVDDASADGTADVAREPGARVIDSQPLPEEWRGKTWACHQGAQAATGKWLLFLDADTYFEADGLSAVLAEFRAGGGGALSIAPHHTVRTLHEQFSAFFNLVMLAGTGAFTLLGDRLAPRGLLGQFLLVERSAYDLGGGHETLKHRILENFWLAEKLRGAGVRMRCRAGRGVFAFRMYPQGWRELIDGWTKGFASGANQTPTWVLALVIAWMTGLMLAPLGLIWQETRGPSLAAYGLCTAQMLWLLRRVGTFHYATALFYPIPLMFFFAIFARSAWRSGRKQDVNWKGRTIRAG